MSGHEAPEGLAEAGGRLWAAVTDEYELAEHELSLLEQACRVADLCETLHGIVEAEGPVIAGRNGPRPHPAVVELRNERALLARLLVSLRVPIGDAEAPAKTSPVTRLQRRGLRGAYGPRSVG